MTDVIQGPHVEVSGNGLKVTTHFDPALVEARNVRVAKPKTYPPDLTETHKRVSEALKAAGLDSEDPAVKAALHVEKPVEKPKKESPSYGAWHRDGIEYNKAEIPPRKHECSGHTSIYAAATLLLCPCGAVGKYHHGSTEWQFKNSRSPETKWERFQRLYLTKAGWKLRKSNRAHKQYQAKVKSQVAKGMSGAEAEKEIQKIIDRNKEKITFGSGVMQSGYTHPSKYEGKSQFKSN